MFLAWTAKTIMWVVSLMILPFLTYEISSAAINDEGGGAIEKLTDPQVTVKQGTLEGIWDKSRDGRKFYSFRGIPFGKIPQRFNNPVPADGWEGVRPAKQYGEPCTQLNVWNRQYSGVEDCLTINVFVPKMDKNSGVLLPVMFYLYGGAFTMGDATTYGPHYFMDEDVILVVPNYRVSSFGFLDAGIKGASGNQGMKDQVLALKWVKENIQAFGGDPGSVTIFGESAGSISVSHLVASPMASGLFHRAIAQSGTSALSLAQWPDPTFEEPKKLAVAVDCPTSNMEYMVDCLRKIRPDVLAEASLYKDPVWFDRHLYPNFVPGIETYKESPDDKNVFLDELAQKRFDEGRTNRVPLMLGFTSHEGFTLHAAPVFVLNRTYELNARWGRIIPTAGFFWTIAKDPCVVSSKLKKTYFDNKPVSFETVDGLTNFYGDMAFKYPARKVALMHSQVAPVYFYNFTREVRYSFTDIFRWWDFYKPKTETGLKYPAHGDDVQFYFKLKNFDFFPNIEKDSPDYEFSKNVVKLLASFAQNNGRPTHTWGSKLPESKIEPMSDPNDKTKPIKLLRIDNELSMESETEDYLERMNVLDEICRNDLEYCVPIVKK